jgi:hypothetical protein
MITETNKMFWVATSHSSVEVHLRFVGKYSLYLHGRRVSQSRNQQEARGKQELILEMKIGFSSAALQNVETRHIINCLQYDCKLV